MAYMCGLCLDAEYCDEWWWNINDIGCWEFNKDECESYSQCQWKEEEWSWYDEYGNYIEETYGYCNEGPPECFSDECLNAIDGLMELALSDYCTSINDGWLEDCIADCDMEMQIEWTFEIMQEQMLCEICMEEDN